MELESRIRETPHVSKVDIKKALRELGLRGGHKVMVHSSLSSFGYVEPTQEPEDEAITEAMSQSAQGQTKEGLLSKVRGSNTVIAALLECVGHEGTVMMPSFNHGGVDLYDPLTTRSFSGIITDVFWRRPGVRRSLHPTHAYAATGKDAQDLLAGHMEAATFGKDSPLGKLIFGGGLILLLGVGLNKCTAMHVGESVAAVKCIGYRQGLGKVLKDGRAVYVAMDVWRAPGQCRLESLMLEDRMRAAGMIGDIRAGEAQLHIMKGLDLVNTVIGLCEECCVEHCPIHPDYAEELKRLQQELLSLQQRGRVP